MKTRYTFLFLLMLLVSFNVTSQTDVLTDNNLKQAILQKYPSYDDNSDGIITQAEASGLNNRIGTMELTFTHSPFVIDFTGFEHFELSAVILKGGNGNLYKAFNLDLTKIGGILNGVDHYLSELTLDKIYATTLNFVGSRDIAKMRFINGTSDMNLEDLHLTPRNSRSLVNLEVENSGIFATLNLGNRGFLQTVIIRNTYMEGFAIEGNGLTHLFIENAQEFATLSLPNTTTNDLSFLESLTIKGITRQVKLTALDLTKQTNLTYLYLETNAPNTGVSTLDLTKNTKLTDVTISNFDGISSLDLTKNVLLTSIDINNLDAIGSFDFTKNTELVTLKCSVNKLTTLDITKNTKLETFECYNNLLTTIDVTQNTELKKVELGINNLTSINISANIKLERLSIDSNQLTTLDISGNGSLKWLECRENSLVTLNVANGLNSTMNQFDISGVMSTDNPNLTCMYVDANVVNSIPQTWFIDATTNATLDDEINYTDLVFYDKLKSHNPVIDVDGNNKISNCEAENFIGKLDVSNSLIGNLAGIEAFKNITELDCSANSLTVLNVSSNTKLTKLFCQNNSIESIDITALTDIEIFNGSNNSLTTLILGNNKAKLKNFDFSHNQLTGSYSTDGLHNLETFICNDNQLQHIGINLNTKLKYLLCQNNPFSSAGAIDNTIDFTQNADLLVVNCSNNQLQDVDVSNNPLLTELYCKNNTLEKLTISNGNNANLTGFDATGNSVLYCIQVDANVINAIPNAWVKDAIANYASNCSLAVVDETLKGSIKLYPNPVVDILRITNQSNEKIKKILIYTLLGKKVRESNTDVIQFADLKRGLYIVKIVTVSNKMLLQKIVKE